ncbi:MAG: VOC family protein [Clostridia bacterium]|nr:VOC family protein [Clostridia bacterium]
MRIEHIAVYVDDLDGARAFFERYFSAQSGRQYHNPDTGFRSYFLTFEDGARLELMRKNGVGKIDNSSPHTGYMHMAFSVGSRENVDSLTRRLRDDGYEVLSGPRITGDGYYESCVAGFEEILVEITV